VSRRAFWDQIHRIAAAGTTVLLTTHYMDEAERCHRLAFIFGGELLDVGTPEQIVERRALRVVELEVDEAIAAANHLRRCVEVEEVAHYGHLLRVATRGNVAPAAFVAEQLAAVDIAVRNPREARATVEDAFVSMVRADEAQQALLLETGGKAA
jgi:ABC-2 type transport system ATP-binding protein